MKSAEMFLESASGFMMPFAAREDEELTVSLGFGEQTHPKTGEKFSHRGIDLIAHEVPLFALATGAIIGVGKDAVHDQYIIAKYGKYEVKYGHVSAAYADYGTSVTAGQQIAKSGDFLHFEVNYAGEVLDPLEFLGMIYNNMMQLHALGIKGSYRLVSLDSNVRTGYERDQEEIEQLMERWLPAYMNDLQQGSYAPAERMEHSMRNIFAQSADRNYFFERIPDITNPLGLSSRAAPLVGKIQRLLIEDFLSYLALRHNTYLSSWGAAEKKNILSRP